MMDNDRELLERAAKAAGIDVQPYTWDKGAPWGEHEGLVLVSECQDEWDPLSDDGQALRLAMKLNMAVSIHEKHCMACAQTGTMQTVKDMPTDAATRRAIVRAAAAIGEAT